MSEQTLEQTEAQTEVGKTEETISPEQAEQLKKNVLFGTIAYKDDESYESFLQKMNLGQALFVLVASANLAQAKGSFNILESEVLSTAIRIISKYSTPAQENSENSEPVKD